MKPYRYVRQHLVHLCTAAILLVAAAVISCGDKEAAARTELQQLVTLLDAISVENDPHWTDKLDAASALVVNTPQIQKIQRMCVSAYREYADAMDEMKSANQQLKDLEKAIREGKVDGLKEKHGKTRVAIEETTRHLEQSQLLIQACMAERRELGNQLKMVRN